MINAIQIRRGMPVVCSDGGQFAVVDHMEGPDTIKLKKDDQDQHHFIPRSWVTSAERGEVKIDRPGGQAMKEWSNQAPASQ